MSHDREATAGAGGDASGATGGAAAGKRALTDRLAHRAAKKNPIMQARLGFEPARLSSAPVASEEFARDVADKQQQRGLHVDGVAGKKTVTALLGEAFDFNPRGKAKGPPRGKGEPVQRLAELTTNSLEDEHQCVAMIGRDDGVTAEAKFQITYAGGHPVPGMDVTIVRIERMTTVLHAPRGRIVFPPDAGVLVTLPPPPELDLHGDGSIGDDAGDRLEA